MKVNIQVDDLRLDVMLKKYGEAVPRPGLEGRVLTRLAHEREQPTVQAWKRPLSIAILILGTVSVLGVLVALKSGPLEGTAIGQFRNANITHEENLGAIFNPEKNTVTRPNILRHARPERRVQEPRLAQFPAPAPFNEQELILSRYVQEHRLEARVVAKAREEMHKQDLAQFEAALPAGERSQSSE
jgi:hypothetical protein